MKRRRFRVQLCSDFPYRFTSWLSIQSQLIVAKTLYYQYNSASWFVSARCEEYTDVLQRSIRSKRIANILCQHLCAYTRSCILVFITYIHVWCVLRWYLVFCRYMLIRIPPLRAFDYGLCFKFNSLLNMYTRIAKKQRDSNETSLCIQVIGKLTWLNSTS